MLFGRRTRINADSRRVAEEFFSFKSMLLSSKAAGDLITSLNVIGCETSYLDGDECGWFSAHHRNFSFHAHFGFGANSTRRISAEAHEDYFGVVLTADATDEKVVVGLKDLVSTPMGRDAGKMYKTLLTFPQFWDPTATIQRLLGRSMRGPQGD